MSEVEKIIQKLAGTREAEVILQMDESYNNVAQKQADWYEKSKFTCVDGCGECCRNFEPDLLECEAVYWAAWLLENQPEVAEKVLEGEFPFPREKGCQFWNENTDYHCSCYGARPHICRLFGASGYSAKNGETVFKPCKFYKEEDLSKKNPQLKNRQYSQTEVLQIFGTLPPLMSDLMERAVSINPDNHETELVRTALPKALRKLLWIQSLQS